MSKTQAFVEKARSVHGDSYSYCNTTYKTSKEKVAIRCRVHGDFYQSPLHHLYGRGCKKCSVDRQRSTKEDFVEKARFLHGDKFDYSKVVYITAIKKVEILCKKHGKFNQSPNKHLSGDGCPACGNEKNAETHRFSRDDFIKSAIEKHGDLYDYSLVDYVNARDKVKIICKRHGVFEQAPYSHSGAGQGCPRCTARYDEPTNIYVMATKGKVKVGFSIDPESRLSRINKASPFKADLIFTWPVNNTPTAHRIEKEVHLQLRSFHCGLSGFEGATEWFSATPIYATSVVNSVMNERASIQV